MQDINTTATSSDKEVVESIPRSSTTVLGRRTQPWGQWLVVLILVFSDILLALLVWESASVLHGIWGRGALTGVSAAGVVTSVVVWVVLRALLDLYPGYGLNQPEELRRQTYAVAATLAIVAIFAFAFQFGDLLSRLLMVLGFLSLCLLAPPVRHLMKRGMKGVGLWGKPVVIFGAGEVGAHLVETLRREWSLGLVPIAIFDDQPGSVVREREGVPYGGILDDATALARKLSIDTIIFAIPRTRLEILAESVNRVSLYFRHVIVIPSLEGVTNSAVVARDFAGTLGVEIKHNLLNPWVLRTKRALDIGCIAAGAAFILPLFLLISLVIRLESRGPVFYRDQRVGQHGKSYFCIKFRTMVVDAEAMLQRLLEEDLNMREEYARYHKLRDDPRITHVGWFLRKTSLDELPQLWNVLRGEMSLVGPRPYKAYESVDVGILQNEILRVPPGISGLWQVAGRNHTTFKQRVQMDAYYVRNWSIWLDLVILARTVGSVVSSRGAF